MAAGDGRKERLLELYETFRWADETNRKNLMRILSDNEKTLYGQRYGFHKIRSEGDFRRKVPLTEYEAYETMGRRPSDYTAYPVECMVTTSGTTGRQKEFYLTTETLERYSSYICDMPYVLSNCGSGMHLHLSIFRPAKNGRTLLSAAYYSGLREKGLMDFSSFAGGEELLFSDKISEAVYVKAWLAISNPELVSIQGIFLYDALLLFSYIEGNWKLLLEDMRSGQITAGLEDSVKEALLACRLKEMELKEREEILEEGFHTPIVPRLWPKLKFISGIGGEMYKIQGEALKKYTGDVPVYYFAYASSECMAGIALEMDKAEYALLPGSAYYEFLAKDGMSLLPGEVYIGEEYEVVVTTFSGLYRYRTGDIVRIVSFIGETPVFKVIGRRKSVLNLAGEKLDEETVRAAVERWAEEEKVELKDFAVGIDTEELPGRYCLFGEIIGKDTQEASGFFDSILCELSPDYQDVRSLGMLRPAQVCVVKEGSIVNILSEDKERHNKPHTFLNPQQTFRLMGWSIAYGK